MSQFKDLVAEISIPATFASISVEDWQSWKATLDGTDSKFSFLQNKVWNWPQLNLSGSSASLVKEGALVAKSLLGVEQYPAYFLLDVKGKVVDKPFSGAVYLAGLFIDQTAFWTLILNPKEWLNLLSLLLLP